MHRAGRGGSPRRSRSEKALALAPHRPHQPEMTKKRRATGRNKPPKSRGHVKFVRCALSSKCIPKVSGVSRLPRGGVVCVCEAFSALRRELGMRWRPPGLEGGHCAAGARIVQGEAGMSRLRCLLYRCCRFMRPRGGRRWSAAAVVGCPPLRQKACAAPGDSWEEGQLFAQPG